MNQFEARSFITKLSKKNQIGSTGANPNQSPYTAIGDSNNRYLFYDPIRKFSGEVYPRKTQNNRGSQGQTFPRMRLKYT